MVHCVHYTGQLLNSSLVQFGFGTCEQWPPQPTFKNGLSQIDQSLKLSRALPDCAEMFLGWCFMGWPAVVGTGGLIIHLSLFLVIETVGRMSMAILKRRYAFWHPYSNSLINFTGVKTQKWFQNDIRNLADDRPFCSDTSPILLQSFRGPKSAQFGSNLVTGVLVSKRATLLKFQTRVFRANSWSVSFPNLA